MKTRKRRTKKYKLTYIYSTLLTLFIGLLFFADYTPFDEGEDNYFYVEVNGQYVGSVDNADAADRLLREARRAVAGRNPEEMTFLEASMSISGKKILWGELDDEQKVLDNMVAALEAAQIKTRQKSYTVKLNELFLSLGSLEEVQELLQAAVDKYDVSGQFGVDIHYDYDDIFNALTVDILTEEDFAGRTENTYQAAGAGLYLEKLLDSELVEKDDSFESYATGVLSMDFDEKIKIVESYMPESALTGLEQAKADIVADQEKIQVYKVVSGDTLSEIAIKVNIPMDTLIEMNDSLEDERSILQIGQELVITVPEPVLSVRRVEQNYYEEIYDEEIQVIEIDTWYTNQIEVVQQPSAGFRRIIADVTYINDTAVEKVILKEEIVAEAVPKIIKRGTKIPPTYVKPISGGRLSSSFGPRTAPKPGASTYHQGIDWAIPQGTPVYASCGGTIAKAGWGSGYGYVVYIDHEDGKQTRYGHLSKILVSVGDKVKQGDKIALSGNTGVSTGPHLHFEILVNGKKVNPLNYVSK